MRRGLTITALCVAACSDLPPAPLLERLEPDRIDSRTANAVTLHGDHFHWRLAMADFEAPRRSRRSTDYRATLIADGLEQPLEEVQLVDRRTLRARVPAGLPVGAYALRLVDPWRRRVELSPALTVFRDTQQVGDCVDDDECIEDDPCTTSERCVAGRCEVGPLDKDSDDDGGVDLACGGDDCDDGDEAIFQGAAESCDLIDSDCDGSLVDGFADLDGDGLPDCVDPDDDGDLVPDDADTDPADRYACQDLDADGCDDCALTGGPPDPANDGPDADGDGQCGPPAFTPSYGVELAWLVAAATDFAPAADVLLDTDLGTIDGVPLGADFHVVGPQDCGGWPVELGVFAFRSVTVPAGVTVRAVGARALVLGAREKLYLLGVIDATGGTGACGAATCPGPGGFAGGGTANPGIDGSGPGGGGGGRGSSSFGDETGGGGAGHGGQGGRGGNSTDWPFPPGGAGGASYAPDALCGGSGGGGSGFGNGTPPEPWGGGGGGGGGAVMLLAGREIELEGTGAGVNAGGGGGETDLAETYNDGGGGGGSGGAILLESPLIKLEEATLAANGGGGGGGNIGGALADHGTTGLLGDTPAPGGQVAGAGGAGSAPDGQPGTDQIDGTGGGGGAVGRIVVRTEPGGPVVSTGITSPPAVIEELNR